MSKLTQPQWEDIHRVTLSKLAECREFSMSDNAADVKTDEPEADTKVTVRLSLWLANGRSTSIQLDYVFTPDGDAGDDGRPIDASHWDKRVAFTDHALRWVATAPEFLTWLAGECQAVTDIEDELFGLREFVNEVADYKKWKE